MYGFHQKAYQVYLGNSTRDEVFGIETYQLKMWGGRKFILYDIIYAPRT